MTESRRGLLFGLGAYVLWGAFPLYFPLLEPGGAIEILAHRIVWSAIVMALLVLALRRRAALRNILRDRRTTLLLVVAAATITSNWGTYIYGVNSERVVETSLGYFINPLVTVLMGVVILKERLRSVQWTALGIGFVAVAVLTWDYGRPPWIALVLGVLVRHLRAGQEDGRRRCDREPCVRDDADRARSRCASWPGSARPATRTSRPRASATCCC